MNANGDTDLTRSRAAVLAEVRHLADQGHVDVTGGELNSALTRSGIGRASNPSFHRRASELVASGHLEHGPERRCRISNRTVQTFRIPTPRGRVIDLVAHLSGAGSTSALTKVATEYDRTMSALDMLDALIAC